MKKLKSRLSSIINLQNKKVFFSYNILQRYVTGIVLKGPEIKSIRMGRANLKDAYCYFDKGELWTKGLHISAYEPASHANEEPNRSRKLLLKRGELRRLKKEKQEKGYTIVPLRLFMNAKGWAKLEIGLARGKKMHDKRATIKERDMARSVSREL